DTVTFTTVNDAPAIASATLVESQGGTTVLGPSDLNITHSDSVLDFSGFPIRPDLPVFSGDFSVVFFPPIIAPLTGSIVSINDPDSSSFTFTVTNVTHGKFQTTTDGVTWVDATTFTGDDLAANHVQFVHDGGEAAPTFSIQADDGAPINNLSNIFTGSVSFSNVNDAPATTPVTLAAIAEDSGARLITQAQLLSSAAVVENNTLTASNLQISSDLGTPDDSTNVTWPYS